MRTTIAARFFETCSVFLAIGFSAQAQILPLGATSTRLSTGYVFTEGPLYDRAGGVYFEDMHPSGQVATNPSHIVRYDFATGIWSGDKARCDQPAISASFSKRFPRRLTERVSTGQTTW
jgi:hypothetical protein